MGEETPGFWSSAGTAVGTAFGGGVGGAIGGVLGNAVGGLFGKSDKPDIEEQLRLGHKYDVQTQKDFYRWKHKYGKKYGMTDYEMFMGPSAGATGGTTGGGAVLGNAANQQYMQEKQIERSAAIEGAQRQLDRQTELAKAQISAKATVDAAGKSAEASKYGADTQYDIEQLRYDIADRQTIISERDFNERILPLAAMQMGKTTLEMEKLVNEIALTMPKYKRWELMQRMGVENMIVSGIAGKFGMNDPSDMSKLTDDEFTEFLAMALSVGSHTRREAEGLSAWFSDLVEKANQDNEARRGETDAWIEKKLEQLSELLGTAKQYYRDSFKKRPPERRPTLGNTPGSSYSRFPSHHTD